MAVGIENRIDVLTPRPGCGITRYLAAGFADYGRRFAARARRVVRQHDVSSLRRPRAARMTAADWEKLIRDGAEAGLRHPSLAKLVGNLLARKVDPLAVLELAHAFNEARCRPPKPRQEVFKIVNWCAGQRLPPTQRAGDEKG